MKMFFRKNQNPAVEAIDSVLLRLLEKHKFKAEPRYDSFSLGDKYFDSSFNLIIPRVDGTQTIYTSPSEKVFQIAKGRLIRDLTE